MSSRSADVTLRLPTATAWRRRFDVPPRLPGPTVVLHSQADDGVLLEGSRDLLRHNGLPASALVVVGADHTMIDAEALRALLDAVRAITKR